MRNFIWMVTASLLVVITGVTGCATSINNSISKAKTSQISPNQLTVSKVITDIRNNERSHTVNDIQIIGIKNIEGQGFAFASFNLDGHLKYASIFDSKKQGISIGVFSASQTKGMPLQYTQEIGENGFNLITGVVVNNPDVKNIIVTFSSGYVAQVPVVHGDFWLAGKVGSSYADSYSKQVIGITDKGDIISNHS